MAEAPPDALPTPALATTWHAHLVADGEASLAAGRWPVLLVLVNRDLTAHAVEPQGIRELRLRCPVHGIGLTCHDDPPPAPKVRVPPGGELILPLDLLERVQQRGRLLPGEYRVSMTIGTDGGLLPVPASTLRLGA
ncbi:MAG: hypothetical protein RBU45_24115 [Myxococcota bacterium]|jgi:hypothetical protein|nr:hypothetical protein [Myxococcota bacterium]